ncbi:MAG: 30S ribosomal protein S6 [Clostridia bacterium]|jgi:small subunit ribosomal protein S6|nr:30S ribosomal protein S6 [Clostridia bacterium]
MVKYEVMFIVNPELGEEAVKSTVEKFKALIEANGTIEEFSEWGKRTLKYPINDINEGYYALALFSAEPTFPAELERIFRITDGILRYLVINKEEK